jgi:hypothetical protein
MNSSCSIEGCGSPVRSRFSPYCGNHRKALGRHGHPLQRGIAVAELKPWLVRLQRRQKDNRDSAAWVILRRRWEAVVRDALACITASSTGRTFISWHLEASRLLQGLAGAADADLIVATALAAFMHAKANPHRYVNDRAVLFQVARAVLRLDRSRTGSYYSHKEQRMRTKRREVPPRAAEHIATVLQAAFAGPAAQLYVLEVERGGMAAAEEKQLAEALAALR